jgi:tRNA G18 (ribose-2'-O)-methylase SpoU
LNTRSVQCLYEDALALEKQFDEVTATSANFKNCIDQIRNLDKSQHPDLQKIASLADRLNRQSQQPWTHRQFLDLLVPLERFLNKQVTDADFIHDRPDKNTFLQIPKTSIVLIADHIRSAFNVGAFFRTADAFAIEQIILTGYTPTPDHPAVTKTALGSQKFVAWQHIESTRQAIEELKTKAYSICALETTNNAQNIYQFKLPKKLALLVGNERFGINKDLLFLTDHIIKIPMLGQKNSLNVATTFALVAYEWQKQFSIAKS